MIVCMYVCVYMYVCMYVHTCHVTNMLCVSSDDHEKLWRDFREAIIMTSQLLPLSSGKENKDWVTDKVASLWFRLKKSPSDPNLEAEYQCLRACAKKTAESCEDRGG